MLTQNVEIAGAVVYWQLGWTRRATLAAKFDELGLDKYTPKLRRPGRVLRHALHELYGNPKTLVRPLRDRSGFVVIDESRGEERNEYLHRQRFTVDKATGVISADGYCERLPELQRRYDDLATQLSPVTVGKALVDLVGKKARGISLRSSGGVYWVPEAKLDIWQRIVAAVEESAIVPGTSTVYMIQSVKDVNCVKAVRAAIVAEVTAQIQTIEQELADQTIGERAWNSRIKQTEQMRRKLATYEDELNISVGSLQSQIEGLRERAAMASIVAAAKAHKDGGVSVTESMAQIGVDIEAARKAAQNDPTLFQVPTAAQTGK